jgi:hypothetical protein
MRIHHPDRVGTGAGHGEHRGGVASGKEVMEAKEVKEAKDAPPCFCVSRGNKGVSGRKSEEKGEGVGRIEMAQEQRPLSITTGA